jgi:predicted metal-binding membrane protein
MVGLVGLIALSWSYLVPAALDMYGSMSGPSGWMMAATWDARYFVLMFVMWCVMMTGMMLPSAAPMILLFAKAVQRSPHAAAPIARAYAFASGYLAAWSLYEHDDGRPDADGGWRLPMDATQASVSDALPLAAALVVAPLARWRSRRVSYGRSHGLHCVGCCRVLMLLLFVGGVMNLLWIAPIAGFVLLERLALFGPHAGRRGEALLVAAGVWLLLFSPA